MRRVIGVLILLPPAAVPADEACKLLKLAEVPVSLEGRQPVITAKINGVDALFAVDSGAFWSTLSTAAARQYGLDLDRTGTSGMYIQGIGGNVALSVATVKVFTIFIEVASNAEPSVIEHARRLGIAPWRPARDRAGRRHGQPGAAIQRHSHGATSRPLGPPNTNPHSKAMPSSTPNLGAASI